MLFNSIDFLVFFPIVTMMYFIIPQKYRYIWLLGASYYFYMSWNAEYALLLLFSTIVTYIASLGINWCNHTDKWDEKKRSKIKKGLVAGSVISNLLILFFFKYFNFAADSMVAVLELLHITIKPITFDVILPVGISFYIFQALSYTMDVYREDVTVEQNFFRYALFVSFFPQLVAGPIERSKNLLLQLREEHHFSYERMKDGLLLMLWGYFIKVVLADRIAIFVDTVYSDLNTYEGYYVLIASILFAFQIYCDFAGYSIIAMGAAKIMGFSLMENFNAPYLSSTVSEFLRRWHISLSTWFRDYLYIHLGGNRKGIVRKYLNLFIVFMVSGLWHGANWTYVIWGGLNGIFQIIGDLWQPIRDKMQLVLGLDRSTFSHKLLKIVATFVLVDFTWIFFRASTITDAMTAIRNIVLADNTWIFFDGSLYELGLSQKDFHLMICGIGVLMVADILKYKGICIREKILQQEWWFRWLVAIGAVLIVLIYGIYGYGYDAQNFIYFQF